MAFTSQYQGTRERMAFGVRETASRETAFNLHTTHPCSGNRTSCQLVPEHVLSIPYLLQSDVDLDEETRPATAEEHGLELPTILPIFQGGRYTPQRTTSTPRNLFSLLSSPCISLDERA